MKRLLVIGASVLQLPAIKRAKELGYYVATADYNPNAIGISIADEYYNVSTIDIDGVVSVAKQFEPDGIITLGTDMPMRSVAAAISTLGLPGITLETAIKATDKGEMMKVFKENGIESPWFYIVKDHKELIEIEDELIFPCIMKPTDNAGSRGVVLINDRCELEDAYVYSRKGSRNGSIIIEEYMKGNEVSVETITIDGKVHVLAVTDKITTGAPHFVEMGHCQQSQLGKENVNKIEDLAKRAVNAIGINYGPAHVEIMLTEDGPKMIELGARMGGDFIATHLIPLSTGIDMVGCTIQLLTGLSPDFRPKFHKGSAIRYFDVPRGKIINIHGIEEAKKISGIEEIILMKKVGNYVSGIQNSSDRVGLVIAKGNDAKDAVEICNSAIENIKIRTISKTSKV